MHAEHQNKWQGELVFKHHLWLLNCVVHTSRYQIKHAASRDLLQLSQDLSLPASVLNSLWYYSKRQMWESAAVTIETQLLTRILTINDIFIRTMLYLLQFTKSFSWPKNSWNFGSQSIIFVCKNKNKNKTMNSLNHSGIVYYSYMHYLLQSYTHRSPSVKF